MGKKHKLQRFAENETFTNLFQHHHYDIRNEGFPMKGKWHEYFHNDHPIVVELGCGRGEYTVTFAQSYPDTNFIGIDKKGARLWRGCKDGIEQNITNAAFIRTQIDFIDAYFAPGEVSEIWAPKGRRRNDNIRPVPGQLAHDPGSHKSIRTGY